jgi:predicted ATPase with chaperone activity
MFLSCKNGKVVSRFGTGTMIGAELGPSGYTFDEKVIVALSPAEVARYGSEYRRAVRRGDLIERTQADFDARIEAEKAAERATLEKMAAEAAEAKAAEQAAAEAKKAAEAAEVGAIENG